MNFRSVVCAGSLAIAAAASAAVTAPESNVFGWMRIDTDQKYTVVAVPWLACEGGNVKVADLVKTDNLAVDDMLYVYTGTLGNYNVWRLEESAGGRVWKPVTVASADGLTLAPGAADATLVRGSALWLYQANPVSFYVYGQYAGQFGGDAPALTPNAFNLIANPNPTAYNLNNTANPVVGLNKDVVIVPADDGEGVIYRWNGDKWVYTKETTEQKYGKTVIVQTESDECLLPPGKGAWYVSSSETVPTIKW